MLARARLLAMCLVALALTACATATLTRIAYNNAASTYSNLGPMLTWIVDGYADLDGDREDWVRSRLERTLSWHRAEELPKVRELLETMLRKSDAPFRVEDIAQYQRELREAYRRVLRRLIPDTAELLAERRYRRSEVVRLVKERAPKAQLEAELRRLFLETDAWRRADYKERMAARDAKLHGLIAELSATLNDRQREALKRRIHVFINDVAKLSAQAR